MDSIKNLDVDAIKLRKDWNIRTAVIKETIADLVESIKAIGVQSPILVNESMELVAGYRRLCAVKSIGLKTIPARVKSFPSSDHERLSHIDENLQMKSLSEKDMERALSERKAIWKRIFPESTRTGKKDKDQKNSFEAETAKVTGEKEHSIRRKILRVDNASERVRASYDCDEISKTIVDEIVRLPIEMQDMALDKILENGMSAAEARLLVTDIIAKKKEAIIKDAVKKFNESVDKKAAEAKETAPPEPEFKPIADINVEHIENAAYTKRIMNNIKSVNSLLIRYIKEESWHGVSAEMISAFRLDIEAMCDNIEILNKALKL